jgi:hypothetical protein
MRFGLFILALLLCNLYSQKTKANEESIYYEDIKPIVVWVKKYKKVKGTHNEFNLSQNTREYSELTEKCRNPINNFLAIVPTIFGTSIFDDPDSIPSSTEAPMQLFLGRGVDPVNKDTINELLATCDSLVKSVIAVQDSARSYAEKKAAEKLEKQKIETERRNKVAFENKLDEYTAQVVESYTCLGLMNKGQKEKEEWYGEVKAIAKQHQFSGVYPNGMESYVEYLKENSSSPVERTLIRIAPGDNFNSYDQARDIVFYSNDNSGTVLAVRNRNQEVMGSRLKAKWVAFLSLGSYETILGTRKQYFLIEEIDGEQVGLPDFVATGPAYCAIDKEKLKVAVDFIKSSKKEDVLIRKLNESFDNHGLPRMSL